MTESWLGRGLTPADALERMTLIRRFEETVLKLSLDGRVQGSVHLCLGQEAIPVGAVAALRPTDRVLATYRGHGWALALGTDPSRLMAEIRHRATGVNGGRAGSPLLSDPEHGFFGENSIVGAGVPIGGGLALAARVRGEDRVILTSIGDGAMNQGSVTEGLVFAAAKSLPLIVLCENNGWSEMTATSSLLRNPELADRAIALGIEALVVDGDDPFAVRGAVASAAALCRDGRGPVFIDARTHRLSGHYNRDIQHYRPKPDQAVALAAEPLARLVRDHDIASSALADIEASVAAAIDAALAFAEDSPVPDSATAADHTYGLPLDTPAGPAAPTETVTYQKAINAALRDELTSRPDLLIFGEDVGDAGGIFGVTRSLQREFGPERVFDTPISESAILGASVGAGMAGVTTVAEIMWGDFLFVAFDQLINQASNVRYVNQSRLHAPMTVRVQQGATPGSCAQHAQSVEAILAHIPGIKVGLPATVQDAYDMTRAAIADPDPTIVVEHRILYQTLGDLSTGGAVERADGAGWRRAGRGGTIVTWGAMVPEALAAAETLSERGIEIGVLDLRWLRPLDVAALDDAVSRGGGRVLVVHEAVEQGGFGAEVVATISARSFADLSGPVLRLGARDSRTPASPVLQRALIPDRESIVALLGSTMA